MWPAELRVFSRSIRRSPGWAIAVVATIAVALAAVTSMVAVVDAVLLRPLPFPDSERVVILCETAERVSGFCVASPPNAEDWARSSRTLDAVGVARSWPFHLRRQGVSTRVRGGIATAGYFRVLGARPQLGRLLAPDDLAPGSERVAVLRYDYWQSVFGGDPGVLGSRVEIDEVPVTVVGVLARETWIPEYDWVDLWMPLTATEDDVSNRGWRGFTVLAHLAPGVSTEMARQELTGIRDRLAAQHPETNRDWGLKLEPLRPHLVGDVRATLALLLAAVGLLLLIACVNVALLLLAQVSRRRGELAVRAALGAGGRRLSRLLVVESLLLAAVGGVASAGLAALALAAFRVLAPPDLPRLGEVTLDLRVWLISASITLATSLLFAAAPALRAARQEPAAALRAGGRTALTGRSRLQRSLVVTEVALSVLLLVGSALLARGFLRLAAWNPGFDTAPLATIWMSASPGRYPHDEQVAALFRRVAEEVRAVPGVESASLASAGPLFGGIETGELLASAASPGEGLSVRWFDIGSNYFATLGIPLVRGRAITDRDTVGAPPVAVVNEELARRLGGAEAAIGSRVEIHGRALEIVGVVADVPPIDPVAAQTAEIYWPQMQEQRWGSYLVFRHSADASAVERAIAARIAAVDPELSSGGSTPLEASLSREMVRPRFVVWLASLFAAVALLLAAIGTSGVLAFEVAGRTREIGLRMALGASPAQVQRSVLRGGLSLVAGGLALGLASAVASARALRSLLYGVPATDPVAVGGALALLAAAALLACALPARRASKVEPATALRAE